MCGEADTLGQRLDRLPVTRLHLAILLLCTLGLAADIGEVALSNTFSAIFLAPPHSASRAEVSWLLAAVFAGGAAGAPVFGWVADRHGRRAALQIALTLLLLGSLAVALSPDIGWMTLFRFVSGLALGAYPPLTAAYLSDVLPPQRRGMLMMLCAAFAFLGAPAMIFLIRWLTPVAPLGVEGWQWALFAGAAVAAATAGLFFAVPESPRWLATLGRGDEAENNFARFCNVGTAAVIRPPQTRMHGASGGHVRQSAFAALRAERRHLRRAAFLAALYALVPWAAIGFPLLSAAVMVQKGFRISDSLLFAGVSMFGPTLGIGAVAGFVDGIGRRPALILCAAAMAATGIAFAAATTLGLLIALGTAFNLLSAVNSALLSLYAAELFPTELRGSATATAWAIGRVVSALVPIALLPLLGTYGPLAMFAVIAAALLTGLLLIAAIGPPGLARQAIE
jgi:MFS transporter, putative metabolite:H+ symporter